MNKTTYIATAVAAAIALPAVAFSEPVAAPTSFKSEKCYGIVKAGKNDCQTLSNSCAGTSKKDNQRDAWVYVPAGVCDKIAGSSMTPQ